MNTDEHRSRRRIFVILFSICVNLCSSVANYSSSKAGEGAGEGPGVVEGIVQRRQGGADDVGLAEVADHPLRLEGLLGGARTVEDAQGHLAAAPVGVARADQFE